MSGLRSPSAPAAHAQQRSSMLPLSSSSSSVKKSPAWKRNRRSRPALEPLFEGYVGRYLGDTLILDTRFESNQGAVKLIDFMPPRSFRPDRKPPEARSKDRASRCASSAVLRQRLRDATYRVDKEL